MWLQCLLDFTGGTATDNFGIEAWINPDAASGTRVIVSNGFSNQYGIYQVDGEYQVVLDNTFYDFDAAITGVGSWDHLAIVRDNGTTTLYINGVSAGSTTASVTNQPNAHSFIGGHLDFLAAGDSFDGQIDTVRYFTFNAGEFDVNDLDYVIPEPNSMALLGFSSLLLLRRHVA